MIDGAQAAPHMRVNVQDLRADFYAVSAHKCCGPTGIGVLIGQRELLESLPPWQGGGDMIDRVSFSGTTYNELPWKFEAGTPNIAVPSVLRRLSTTLNPSTLMLLSPMNTKSINISLRPC